MVPAGETRGAQRGQAVPTRSLNQKPHLLGQFWFSTPKVRPDPLFGPARKLRDEHGASSAWLAVRMRFSSASFIRKLLSEN